jgi:hypothetical protein
VKQEESIFEDSMGYSVSKKQKREKKKKLMGISLNNSQGFV